MSSPSKAPAAPARSAGSAADPLSGPRFSAIIPTWSEIDYLPELVERLKSSPRVAEVIVADNASIDGTALAALAAGCTVIEGGRPAEGRNAGAGIAHEDLLLFVDVDAAITSEVIDAIADGFLDGAVVAAHVRLRPLTDRGLVHLCFRFVDVYLVLCERLGRAGAVGTLTAVRKSAFEEVGGFDESVRTTGDFAFMRRLQLSGQGHVRVVYNRSLRLYVSARSFDVENPVAYLVKYLTSGTLGLLGLRHGGSFGDKRSAYSGTPNVSPNIGELIGREDGDGSTAWELSAGDLEPEPESESERGGEHERGRGYWHRHGLGNGHRNGHGNEHGNEVSHDRAHKAIATTKR